MPVGSGSSGILIDPSGTRTFVASSPDNDIAVAVIDLAALTVTGKLDVGGSPDGMAWALRR